MPRHDVNFTLERVMRKGPTRLRRAIFLPPVLGQLHFLFELQVIAGELLDIDAQLGWNFGGRMVAGNVDRKTGILLRLNMRMGS